jgi:TonB family protein
MMPALDRLLLAIGNSLAASILVKVTLTTAVSLVAAWTARHSRAAVRHALMAAAFAVLLLLPIAAMLAPAVRLTVAQPPMPAVQTTIRAIPATAPVRSTAAVPATASTTTLLLAAWITGAALFLLPVAAGLWQVRSLRRSALPWTRGQSLAAVDRRVEVLLHESLPGPITCGILRPAIILSHDAESWSDDDLTRAVVHELEHVRRRDWLTQCLARIICAAYWFHPLVWMAWRRLALEAERSCDDAVLRRFEPTAYADQLVGLAQRLSAAKSPVLAMANRADLSTRVTAVLNARQKRGPAGTLSVTLACALAAALVLAVSPLRIVSAQQGPLPRFMTVSNLVTLTVTVADSNGNAIDGLGANDFILTEDDVPQKISIFEFRAAQGTTLSYYVLGYYTSNRAPDAFHKISVVKKDDPSAKLSFRQGYYTRPAPSLPPTPSQAPPAPGVKPPQLIMKFEPEYSEEARKAKYQGNVLLYVEIDTTGAVTDARVVRSLGLGLDEKAMEAVRKWKFKPASQDGQPIASHSEVEVTFRLL